MIHPLTHLEEEAMKIRLSDEERLRLREHLEHYMLAHPLTPIASPYQRYIRMPAFIFTALFLVVSSGGVIAAKGALPGQPLYGLKVDVVEPLEGAFKFTHEAQTEWQVKLATTRLLEAEDIHASGAISSSTAADLSTRFARSAARAATEVGALASTSPSRARKAAHTLDTSFSDHARAVELLSSTGDASTTPVYSALLTQDSENQESAEAPTLRAAAVTSSIEVSTANTSSHKDEDKNDEDYNHARKLFARVHMLAGESDKRKGDN